MKKLILSLALLFVVGGLSAQDNPKESKTTDNKKSSTAPAPSSEAQNRSISEKALPNKTTGKQQQLDGDTKDDGKSDEKKATEKKPNKKKR